jgi:hypothetical protein
MMGRLFDICNMPFLTLIHFYVLSRIDLLVLATLVLDKKI